MIDLKDFEKKELFSSKYDGYVFTRSGILFNLMKPDPDDIILEDIVSKGREFI